LRSADENYMPAPRTALRIVALLAVAANAAWFVNPERGAAADSAAEKPTIAVVDFQTQGDIRIKDAAKIIPRLLLAEFAGKFALISRSELDALLSERDLRMSDLSASTTPGERIKILPVKFLVVGDVMKGADWWVTAHLIEVSNAKVHKPRKIRAKTYPELEAKAPLLARLLTMSDEEYQSWLGEQSGRDGDWSQGVRKAFALPPGFDVPHGAKRDTLGFPLRLRNRKDGGTYALIPGGSFLMGSDEGDADEQPVHKLWIDDFYMAIAEVSESQFAAFVRSTGYRTEAERSRAQITWRNHPWKSGDKTGSLPVAAVSQADALAYCRWAGTRLPTEAEWEKAARGKDGRRYPWGNKEPTSALVNCHLGQAATPALKPCGDLPAGASPFGCLQMAGNVWEWVADSYDPYFYRDCPALNPLCKQKPIRLQLRGGDMHSSPKHVAASNRYEYSAASWRPHATGFRCAASVPSLHKTSPEPPTGAQSRSKRPKEQ